MKNSEVKIVVGVIGFYLFAAAEIAGVAGFPGQPGAAGESQAQRLYSNLQKDEVSLTHDIKLLRRDLRRNASVVGVEKERNFVRQDLLNIVLDRVQPTKESWELQRDQDLASVIGESFAGTAQELINNLEPASRS